MPRCPQFAQKQIKLRKINTKLQLFHATALLTSVCIEILGWFIRTERRDEYFLVVTDRFSMMKNTLPMKEVSAAEVTGHFIHVWVFNYGPSQEVIADVGGCFTSKFLSDICKIMTIKNNFTTTYCP